MSYTLEDFQNANGDTVQKNETRYSPSGAITSQDDQPGSGIPPITGGRYRAEYTDSATGVVVYVYSAPMVLYPQ